MFVNRRIWRPDRNLLSPNGAGRVGDRADEGRVEPNLRVGVVGGGAREDEPGGLKIPAPKPTGLVNPGGMTSALISLAAVLAGAGVVLAGVAAVLTSAGRV